MKTDDLIKALVADTATHEPPVARTVGLAVAGGVVVAAALFLWLLGLRSDFGHAITHDPRFMFKFVFMLGVAIPAFLLVRRLARPDGNVSGLGWLLALPLVLLAAAVLIEMYVVPPDHWPVSAMGSMPVQCMENIPLLAVAPLVLILYALRNGAPASPAAAGAAAGLLSAAIGAGYYAMFCVDDSPMFIAIWYIIGMAIVTAIGAIVGSKILKW